MNDKNSFKNFSYIGIARLVSSLLQALFYMVFASLLEPSAYGAIGYIIALAGTASVISRIGLNHTIVVYQAKGKYTISNQVNILALITTTVASLILIPINELAAILCFTFSLYIMNLHNLLGLKKYKREESGKIW